MFYTFETINYTYKGRDQSVVAEGKEAVCFFNIIVGVTIAIVNRGNGYETRQSSLLYVFVLFFGLDPAQNTIVVYSVLRN